MGCSHSIRARTRAPRQRLRALGSRGGAGLIRNLPPVSALAQTATSSSLLASWNDGDAKQAIFDLVRATTGRISPKFVPPEDRIAHFRPSRHAVGASIPRCGSSIP